ncbi:MAG: hypothetical protein ACW98Y_06700 [Candidatus Thorarchaeota archaeon]
MVGFIVASTGFLVSTANIFQFEPNSNNSLEWANIGNSTLIFDFTIFGRFVAEDAYQYWFPLNNSPLRITIDRLPALNSSMSPEWYIENVANSDKVQVSKLDGSEIKFSLRTVIEMNPREVLFSDFLDGGYNKSQVLGHISH